MGVLTGEGGLTILAKEMLVLCQEELLKML